jgi:hypothetical protein
LSLPTARVERAAPPYFRQAALVPCIQSSLSGTPPNVVTAADGLSAVEICEAEEKSVNTGSVVLLVSNWKIFSRGPEMLLVIGCAPGRNGHP